jgi:TolA-binding protein
VLKSSGQEKKAAEVLRGLVERYPATASAKKARGMLDTLAAK